MAASWTERIEEAHRWLGANETLLWWSFAMSLAVFLASLIAIPFLVARMPADYFVRPAPRRDEGHWVARALYHGAKNAVGVVLFAMGLVMLVTPGQGVLTMLIGIGLTDFPGKRKLELIIARSDPVRRSIAWIRVRAGRPPLLLPGDGL